MKTEIDRISELMYTLLEHQPAIDVPYEKINDIAIALVKEGYGKVSEYEPGGEDKIWSEQVGRAYINGYKDGYDKACEDKSEIIRQLNADYDKAWERLKSNCREIGELKAQVEKQRNEKWDAQDDLECYHNEIPSIVKQAQIDVLTKLKERYGLYYLSVLGVKERMLSDILNPMIEELKK